MCICLYLIGDRLPVGSTLGHYMTVAMDPELYLDLPPDIYLVTYDKRHETSILNNPNIQLLSGIDIGLGEGQYLYPGIKIVRLLPHFIIPRGVTIEPGACSYKCTYVYINSYTHVNTH